MPDSALLLKAARFAAEKHRHQRRKDEKASPYIIHPIEVAELLADVGQIRDVDILCAALLHDTIEDTGTTPEELEHEFGKAITTLVLEVTDDKSLPRAERKRLQVENAAKKSRGAKLIKLADKIANVRDLIESTPAGWGLERKREYVEWAVKVVEQIRGTNEGLEKYFDEVVKKTN